MIEYFIITVLLFVLLITMRNLIKVTQESNNHADRANRYYYAVEDLDKWCRHDLPETEVITKHLIAEGEGLAMNAGTPCGNEACTIQGLREQIRKMKGGKNV